MTYIRFFWSRFDLAYEFTPLGVFWSISWCMILMSVIVFLPDWLITTLGLAMIVGHNALDGIDPNVFGSWDWLWTFLHGQGDVEFPWMKFGTAYKIIPWLGVMMAGYGFGRVMLWERERRQRFIVGLGLAMIAAFFVLRGINVYGDRMPRFTEPNSERLAEVAKFRQEIQKQVSNPTVNPPLPPTTFAVLSFLNCEKYPPSLDYLLMTLGPAFLLLAAADRPLGWLGPGDRDLRPRAALLLPAAHRPDRAGGVRVLLRRPRAGVLWLAAIGGAGRRADGAAVGRVPAVAGNDRDPLLPVPLVCRTSNGDRGRCC